MQKLCTKFVYILSLILLITVFLSSCKRTEESERQEFPDILLRDATYLLGRSDEENILFKAEEIDIYLDDKQANLKNSEFEQQKENSTDLLVSGRADEANINTQTYESSLHGNVHILLHEDNNSIDADEILWDKDSGNITSSGNLTLNYGDVIISGINFTGNIKTGIFTFRSITNGIIKGESEEETVIEEPTEPPKEEETTETPSEETIEQEQQSQEETIGTQGEETSEEPPQEIQEEITEEPTEGIEEIPTETITEIPQEEETVVEAPTKETTEQQPHEEPTQSSTQESQETTDIPPQEIQEEITEEPTEGIEEIPTETITEIPQEEETVAEAPTKETTEQQPHEEPTQSPTQKPQEIIETQPSREEITKEIETFEPIVDIIIITRDGKIAK